VRKLSVSTTINAPADLVWRVLTDTSAYAGWNPFVIRLDGTLAIGERLRARIRPPGGPALTLRPKVTALEPSRRLEWLGRLGIPGLFDGRHSFVLEALPDGRTVLTQAEEFRGLLVPLTGSMLSRTESGFTAMNDALRDRAELLAGATLPPVGGR
jgi:hypothetical protein